VLEMLDRCKRYFRSIPRVFLDRHSMGGMGTWNSAFATPIGSLRLPGRGPSGGFRRGAAGSIAG